MTSTPSAPLRDMADTTSDPVTSPDDLSGVGDRVRNTASSLARPEKSSARGEGGVAGMAANGMSSVSSAATGAYNRAPDLGIGSTASSAYQRAPNLGVGATISSVLGQGADSGSHNDGKRTENVQSGDGGMEPSSGPVSNPVQESEKSGPSDPARVGKTQQQIGTETDIPTHAGLGSTASPDGDNQGAMDKAVADGRVTKAKVPDDYPRLHPSDTDSPHDDGNAEAGPTTHAHQPERPLESQEQLAGLASQLDVEKKRGLGEKIKDQVKGELKILAGTVTGKDDKVVQGLAIKHGEHHS